MKCCVGVQASTSGTQTDKAPVYDSDGSAEVHDYENCYDNEIFNTFTQEEKYTELLEPIPEPHQVPQNHNNIISEDSSVEQTGFESHPPMLNKENYVPWSSRLLWYAKSRPYGKLIHNSIINGLYVRRMIPEPGDANHEVTVTETFHVQTDDELTKKELKQIEADDQAIQTILLGLPEDIYAAVDSCETDQEIWLRVQQMMKGSDNEIQEKKAKLFNEWERFTSNEGESIVSYYHHFLKLMNDLKRNKHFPEKIASNLKFLNNLQPEWSRHVTIVHQTKDLHIADYTQLYNFLKYNQKENYMQQPMPNPEDITYPTTVMNIALALMVKAFKLNYSTPTNNNHMISSNLHNRQIAQPGMNMGQDRQMQMVGGNGNQNQIGNGNLVAARAEGNAFGQNGNQIRCYNYREVGHYARNCTQASTSDTQTDKDLVYDSDGSTEVHENCDDNEIFNMFTQEEQYTELLKPIPDQHQVPQNDNNVISEVTSVEQSEETVEQNPINFEETRAIYDSLYHNLAIKVEKVNSVNRKLKETNADLTTKLARFKNQEKCFKISQEKYDKFERCYQQSVYQEQCLSKKINALHLSTGKQIMTLNEQISDLNKQLSKEKSTVSFLLEEKKKLKPDFKIHEDELLDEQIQLEIRIKELNNILVKTDQSIHMLSPKPDSFYNTEQKMALGYQNPFYLKQAPKKQQSLYDGKVLLEKHDPLVVHDSEETLQLAQETAKFVGDFKSLTKEADKSLAKYKTLELEIEHLLRAVVSQDIMTVVQNNSVGETSNLQTELELTSNSISTPQESKVMKNDKVIAPGMFRINPFKPSREDNHMPNNVRASIRTKPTTISQPPVITKKVVNSDSNGLSSTGVDNTKTRRPRPRSNIKNDRVPSVSKSSRSKNKEVEVEEHHRNLLLSKNKNHMSSACNNVKFDSHNVKSKLVCAMCYPNLFMVRRLGLFQAYDRISKASHQFRLEVFGNCSLQK
nr:hypothetical protein [Tanacetum cinerariifolium]